MNPASPGAYLLTFDMNYDLLTLYDRTTATTQYNDYNMLVWTQSSEHAGCSNCRLSMQDDGNLVLYDGSTVKWAVSKRTKNQLNFPRQFDICLLADPDMFHALTAMRQAS